MSDFGDARCTNAAALVTGLRSGSPEEVRRARGHVATCPACSDILDDTSAYRRISNERSTRTRWSGPPLRVVLGLLAGLQGSLALPWLFGMNPSNLTGGSASSEHLTRDGAFGVALALLGAMGAWRPRWSPPLFGIAVGILVVQAVTGAVDEQAGRVTLHFESTHLLGAPIALLLSLSWLTSRMRLCLDRTHPPPRAR